MRVAARVVGQVVIISLFGQLVFRTRKIYQQALKEAKEKSPRRIMLNVEGVTYIDSAGLGLIVLTSEQVKIENIVFGLSSAVGPVKRILELAQLHKIMLVCETEEEAIRLPLPLPLPVPALSA